MQENDYITKKYLDETLDRRFGANLEEFKRHNSALLESFRGDLKAMTEQFITKQEVRDIVKEELDIRITPLERDVKIIKMEVTDHGRRITRLERKMA